MLLPPGFILALLTQNAKVSIDPAPCCAPSDLSGIFSIASCLLRSVPWASASLLRARTPSCPAQHHQGAPPLASHALLIKPTLQDTQWGVCLPSAPGLWAFLDPAEADSLPWPSGAATPDPDVITHPDRVHRPPSLCPTHRASSKQSWVAAPLHLS